MRSISEIIVHCTATPDGRDVRVPQIRQWHLKRGFKDIGYHYAVYLDGTVAEGRPIAQPGAHCLGHNAHSIGVCYVGGLDRHGHPADTRTLKQKKSLERLLGQLHDRFPSATVHGHREFAAKACPCFDAAKEYRNIFSR